MKTRRSGIVLLFLTGVALLTSAAPAWPQQGGTAGNVTAQQQSNSKPDIDITKNIRRAITKDKSLSVSAHNVQVITRQGHVTLKGAVTSTDEKSRVESVATGIAGAGNVDDQITVPAQ